MCSSLDSTRSHHSCRSTLGLALALAACLLAMPARGQCLPGAAWSAASTAADLDWAWLSRWWNGFERWAGGGVSELRPPPPHVRPSAAPSAADPAPQAGSGSGAGGGGGQYYAGRDPNG